MDHHFIVPCSTLVFLTRFQCKPCFTYKRWFFLGNCFWKPYMANPDFQCNLEPTWVNTSSNLWTWLWTNSVCISHHTKKRSKRYEKIPFWIVNIIKYLDISFFGGENGRPSASKTSSWITAWGNNRWFALTPGLPAMLVASLIRSQPPEIVLEKRALAVLTELHVWKRPWFHNKSCNLAWEEPGNLVGGLCEVIV